MSFQGYVQLEETLILQAALETSAGVPINADDLPTVRIYGPDGLLPLVSGASMSLADSGPVTGATNASPIVVSSSAHGLTVGTRVTLTGVGGNTAANGTFTISAVTTDTFTLSGSTGNGSYTSGGAWNVTGLVEISIVCSAANGFDEGNTYQALLSYAVAQGRVGHNY